MLTAVYATRSGHGRSREEPWTKREILTTGVVRNGNRSIQSPDSVCSQAVVAAELLHQFFLFAAGVELEFAGVFKSANDVDDFLLLAFYRR